MELPHKKSGIAERVSFGRYCGYRAHRQGFVDISAPVLEANQRLLTLARRLEDLTFPLQEAIAERDSVDDELDETARLIEKQIDARASQTSENALHKVIFAKGLRYYTQAALGVQVVRYTDLIARLKAHLAPDDSLRSSLLPGLERHLRGWQEAEEGVTRAQTTLSIARTAKNQQIALWVRTLESAYGALVQRVGKKKADTFFPRRRPPR